ncbi:MAG: glycosyltransferase [Cyclobacteriaceae bacterium]
MNQPLVSIICLSYNHSEFVAEAISSVLGQNYPNIELIVVDDGSSDDSRQVIEEYIKGTDSKFIVLEKNVGNCKAFNKGFRKSKGDFIIDLAADDVLLPDRVMEGISSFNKNDIGVHFCNTVFIDINGNETGYHFEHNKDGKLMQEVPQGDVYIDLIERYFISPPTMMIRREVLEELDGYDETLLYEDFDFWIRSSRNWKYGYTDKVLVKKRILDNSHSKSQFQFRSSHQKSTLAVCQKIKALNRTVDENQALRRRCWYEIKQCIRQGNFSLIPYFMRLLFV